MTARSDRRVAVYDMREDFALLSLISQLGVIDLFRVRVALTSTLMSVALSNEARLRYEIPVLKIEIGSKLGGGRTEDAI